MFLTLFFISVILLAIMMAGFGIKLIVDRHAKITIRGCQNTDSEGFCACKGYCEDDR